MPAILKQVPIGIDDFKKLIEKNSYFIDKTLLIKKVMENVSEILLFTRPRRFGKTLNFSMLKYFLEIPECRKMENEDQDCKYLFKGFNIYQEQELIENHLGKYPVIDFSFKKIKANNWEDARYYFKEEIAKEYLRHRYLLNENVMLDFEKKQYQKIMNKEAKINVYTSTIKNLSNYLSTHYEQKVIVLIDEYDTPLHYAKLNGYYKEMLDIMRALLVDGLKGNKNLEKGIVTGIMKISQESIFSSFNNPDVATVTDGYCADMYGFTEKEVRTMLDYYGLSTEMKTVQEWYNGYLFGNKKVIYNPWSILKFIKADDHNPELYWVNTGDTGLLKKCLQLDEVKSKDYIQRLLHGETLDVKVEQNIVYEDVFNDVDKALSYLLHGGYLKAKRKSTGVNKYLLSIPNREIKETYINILQNWFNREQKINNLIKDLLNHLLADEIDKFEEDMASILLTVSSYYDAARVKSQIKKTEKKADTERYENFYHGLMLGIMINIMDEYYVISNQEYGKGRPDLVLIPRDITKKAYILEFKNEYTSSSKKAAEAASEALQQIDEKQYGKGINKAGVSEIVKIGLGFKGKEVNVKWKHDKYIVDKTESTEGKRIKESELTRYYGIKTYSDYLSWHYHQKYEIIEGKVYKGPFVVNTHYHEVCGELYRQISNYLLYKKCKVYTAPFNVRLPESDEKDQDIKTVVQPSLTVICDLNRLDENGYHGLPEFVIEILSLSKDNRKKEIKKSLYKKYGIQEYWFVDYDTKRVEVNQFDKNKKCLQSQIYKKQDKIPVGIFDNELLMDLEMVFGIRCS